MRIALLLLALVGPCSAQTLTIEADSTSLVYAASSYPVSDIYLTFSVDRYVEVWGRAGLWDFNHRGVVYWQAGLSKSIRLWRLDLELTLEFEWF